jgi:hypothetical protein
MTEKQYPAWDYETVQELERLTGSLVIVPRGDALAFFAAVATATGRQANPVERLSGSVFQGMTGVVAASDRKDFSVTFDTTGQKIKMGFLMLEIHDVVIGVLMCVARVSDRRFLTSTFTGDYERAAAKRMMAEDARH